MNSGRAAWQSHPSFFRLWASDTSVNAPVTMRALAVIVLLVGAPIVVAWLLTKDAAHSLGQLTPEPVPVTALVTEAPLARSVRVEISQEVLPGAEVYGSGAAGTITAVHVAVNDVVAAGDKLVSVDGFPIRAWTSDVVLYRDLSSGARGDDVAAVQELLGTLLGRAVPTDGIFGMRTREAVEEYERSIGVLRPTGTILRSWFAQAPEGLIVSETPVRPGRPAPGPTDVMLRGKPTYGGLTVRVLAGPETAFVEGTYELNSAGRAVLLDRDATGWRATDPREFDALFTTPVPELTSRTIEGQLREASPGIGTAIPPSALFTQDGSAFCVIPATEPWTSLPVTPVSTSPDGAAILAEPLDHFENPSVLVNPGEIAPDVPCRSS